MNDRIDTLRKPGASFAALKELVSCCLHYQLQDNYNHLSKVCCGTLQCTVEGYNLDFHAEQSADGSVGKEIRAQVSTSSG